MLITTLLTELSTYSHTYTHYFGITTIKSLSQFIHIQYKADKTVDN